MDQLHNNGLNSYQRTAQNALQFLERTQLNGKEVPALVEVQQMLFDIYNGKLVVLLPAMPVSDDPRPQSNAGEEQLGAVN